ncbi:mitochondrial amidoxime-reducing component 1-like [Ruditapes philippinarum]|uniref:mitochondrial amidoxime-reducing component 1-like n=1 Tax=Ruditapes philippinarum TaxID=129788 RepID=UPI00295B3F81|nr:mitochondrial amidoxime-reducing component 1-like [Ruditapes philippinarum]
MDVLIALGIGTTFKVSALSWIAYKRQKVYVGQVSRINVFPLKSARELQNITNVTLTKHGLMTKGLSDRHWVVTRNGQRQNIGFLPTLTLIRTSVEGTNLRLDAPNVEPLMLPIHPDINQENLVTILVKEQKQSTLDCGDKAAAWISKVVGKDNLRLHHSAPSLEKRLSHQVLKDWPTQIRKHDEVAFQDFVPCMIMCQSSMDVLNQRLDKPVSSLQFRPNIMIEGSEPFDEVNWQTIYIGDKASTKFVDNCTRCAIVTVDPETGSRSKDNQPLAELKKFRCMEPYGPFKPVMGIHTAVETEGDIKIGDPVYVVKK